MADPSVINEWLKKADEDFGFAVSIIEDSTFYAQICFYFHQAAPLEETCRCHAGRKCIKS